jgi:hypothetical protein
MRSYMIIPLGNESIYWDHVKQVEHLDEKRISLRKFKEYFQEKYLYEHYYERKLKEFFEIN